jgi:Tol biopolymer transport system component
MVGANGVVKVLDFGLAKLTSPGLVDPSADTRGRGDGPETEEGTIVGTVAYMSPEQAEGKRLDARSDIFSFGSVLYEMASGRKAFPGATRMATLSAIMTHEPERLAEAVPGAPPELDRLVARCLKKDPERRWQNTADLKVALEELRNEVESGAGAARPRQRKWSRRTVVLTLLGCVAALGGYWWLERSVPPDFVRTTAPRVVFASMPPPDAVAEALAISPDGRNLAFIAANNQGVDTIWVRDLESGSLRGLPGTENVWQLFWSPDSRMIGFSTPSQLKKVGLTGEPPETLWDAGFWSGGAWSGDEILVAHNNPLAKNEQLFIVPATGGRPTPVPVRDEMGAETIRAHPDFLPDGVHFLYEAAPYHEPGRIYVGSTESPETTFLVESDSQVRYADGHVLFVQGGTLLAQRFDATSRRLTGEPQVIGSQLMSPGLLLEREASFSVSDNGILAFRSGSGSAGQLVWFDREGRELSRVATPRSGEYLNPSLSPDGRRIAVNRRDPATGNVDIWLIDVSTNVASRFTSAEEPEMDLVWSPDGDRVAFAAYKNDRYRLVVKPAEGGDEELLWETTAPGFGLIPSHWSPDGELILCSRGFEMWAVPISGDREPWAITESGVFAVDGRFSPDGKWMAFASAESGNHEIYVQSFPEGKNRKRLSTEGGSHPRWRGDGAELFYYGGANRLATVMSVEVRFDSSGFQAGVPEPVFEQRFMGLFDARNNFAVSPDAQRFLLRRPSLEAPPVTVVVHWTAGLESR